MMVEMRKEGANHRRGQGEWPRFHSGGTGEGQQIQMTSVVEPKAVRGNRPGTGWDYNPAARGAGLVWGRWPAVTLEPQLFRPKNLG